MNTLLRVLSIIIIITIITLSVTSCVNAELEYKIHDDDIIILYNIAIDETAYEEQYDTQINRILKSLEFYWKKQGFDVSQNYSKKNNSKTIQGKKIISSSNVDTSFLTLIDILTNEKLSPFDNIEYTRKSFFIFDIIDFNADIDTHDILDFNADSGLPKDILNKMNLAIDDSSLSIAFTTSLKVKESNANEILEIDRAYKKYIWYIKNDKSNNISISFHIINHVVLKLICAIVGIILSSILLVRLNKKLNQTQYAQDRN